MKRQPFECSSCHRRFKIPQALFGHLRQCQWHRLKRKAKAEAENQPPRRCHSQQKSKKSRDERIAEVVRSQHRGRDSQENLLLLLDLSEVLPKLKWKSLDYGAIARLLRTVRPQMTTPEEWMALYTTIDDIERDYEQMVMRLRLDRIILFRTYHKMLAVKNRWMNYLSTDFNTSNESICDDVQTNESSAWYEEAQMWDTIMTNIKRMLVSSY